MNWIKALKFGAAIWLSSDQKNMERRLLQAWPMKPRLEYAMFFFPLPARQM